MWLSFRHLGRRACSPQLARCFASSSADQLSAIKLLRERSGAPMADVRAALLQTDWQMDQALQELRKKGLAATSKKAARNAAQGLVAIASEGEAAVIVEVNSETDFVARNDQFVSLMGQVAVASLHAPSSGREDGFLDVGTMLTAQTRDGWTVGTAIDNVASVVREKMALRRGARVEAQGGVVGTYLHGSTAPGVGRMGALVGLACKHAPLSEDAAAAAKELGGKLAMHIVAMRPPYLDRESVPDMVREAEAVMLRRQAAESGRPANVLEKMVLGRLNKFYQDVCLLEQPFVMDDAKRIHDVLKEFNKNFECELHVTQFVRLQVGEDLKDDVNALGQPSEMAKTQL